jgi:hypothetical protein
MFRDRSSRSRKETKDRRRRAEEGSAVFQANPRIDCRFETAECRPGETKTAGVSKSGDRFRGFVGVGVKVRVM